MVCARSWGKGQGVCCLTRTDFPFGKMKASENDGHDGCQTVKTQLNLKMIKMVKFTLCIFY